MLLWRGCSRPLSPPPLVAPTALLMLYANPDQSRPTLSALPTACLPSCSLHISSMPCLLPPPPFLTPAPRCRQTPADGGWCLEERYALRPPGESDGSDDDAAAAERARRRRRGGPLAAMRRAALRVLPAPLRLAWRRALLPALFFVAGPLIAAALRLVVRKKEFWERGLKSAYFNAKSATPELLYRYRLPALVRGWERGILLFLRARLSGEPDDSAAVLTQQRSGGLERNDSSSSSEGDTEGGDVGLLRRFAAQVARRSIPVTILHGEQDGLVPIANSTRLAAVLDAPLVKISDCGHTPAEEVPLCFVDEVQRFVAAVQASSGTEDASD